MQLMLFWWGHHNWSRRYGLEDGASMLCSLALVATMLIYIYPLRVIISAFFANATGGSLPLPFELDVNQIGSLYAVFGAGFSTLAALLVVLYLIALKRRTQLVLGPLEVFFAPEQMHWSEVCLRSPDLSPRCWRSCCRKQYARLPGKCTGPWRSRCRCSVSGFRNASGICHLKLSGRWLLTRLAPGQHLFWC